MQVVELNNGVKTPILGYGVYQISDLKECQRCVEDALSVGYKSIDTAQAYFNEEAISAAIKTSGIKREELFITTKLWISDMSLIAGLESGKSLFVDHRDPERIKFLNGLFK
ncbi:aldo/keto reductase [Campylobacter iguaniorum]|uniref:aldo/keto reductase n=1 Tax=Campylobacter iguaniorum TaxID=1244531 RepID=UPI0009EE425F|nr:aldo/keto reductase [Campylobacter iguaniorum]